MTFTFEQLFAADPSNPSNIAQDASITIFAPGDATLAPLTITDPDGSPLPNPLTVNTNGFGPAFAHATLDRVAWAGGGFTGFVTSYDGMKNEAVTARTAAESAAASAAASAALVEAPADTAIAAAINGTATQTRAALDADYAPTGITKAYVGLGSVDNTADAAKPVSAAQQAALNAKSNEEAQKWAGWRSAVTKMGTETVRWLAVGDSITEGTGVTSQTDTWVYKAGTKLRAAFPSVPSNAKNPRGWTPIAGTSSTLTSSWTITGTNSITPTFGFRRTRTVQLTGAGAKISGSVTGTAIDIWYATGTATAAFAVSIDGGAGVSIGGSSGTTLDGNVTRVNLGASGTHTVTITRGSGDCYISGITVLDGNETSGISTVNAGWHGSSTTNWINATGAADWKRSVGTLNPQLVTIMLSTNDYALTLGRITLSDNMKMLVAWIRDNVAGWPTIVLVSPYKRTATYTPAWEHYQYGLERAAREIGCGYFDLRTKMPDIGIAQDTQGYYYDDTHPNAVGMDKIATEITNLLIAKSA